MPISPVRPPASAESAPVVAHSQDNAVRVGTRLSNLDRNGKLVKRGVVVTHRGALRFEVLRVRAGRCIVMLLDPWGHPRDGVLHFDCEDCTVVA